MKFIKSILFLSIFSIPVLLFGQEEDCSEKLKRAESLYEEGNIEQVESIITPCLKEGGFTKAEEEEVFKLLLLVGLFEDNFEEAEKNMIRLLKLNPDFTPKPNDPIELKDLYSKFRTDPLYTLGIKIGLNSSYTTILQYYSINNSSNESNYSSGLGFQIIGDFNLMLTSRLMWNIEPFYTSTSFINRELYNNGGGVSETENIDFIDARADQKLNYTESQTSFGISTGFKINLTYKKKITPYIITGAAYNTYLKINSEVDRSYTDLSGSINADKKTIELQKNIERTSSSFQLNYGLGLKFKLKRGNLVVEARHVIGLKNITENRYQDELLYRYNYVLDDVTVNSFFISIGYIHSIYKPKILKRKLK